MFIRLKYFYQKITRGYSDQDLWSLDHTFAVFMYPRLKTFIEEHNHGHPFGMTQEEWNGILNKILWSLGQCINQDEPWTGGSQNTIFEELKEYEDRKKEGLILLGKYFSNLWD